MASSFATELNRMRPKQAFARSYLIAARKSVMLVVLYQFSLCLFDGWGPIAF